MIKYYDNNSPHQRYLSKELESVKKINQMNFHSFAFSGKITSSYGPNNRFEMAEWTISKPESRLVEIIQSEE